MSNIKVVLIETQYVKTDVSDFKSTVQRLTGKDSSLSKESKPKMKLEKPGIIAKTTHVGWPQDEEDAAKMVEDWLQNDPMPPPPSSTVEGEDAQWWPVESSLDELYNLWATSVAHGMSETHGFGAPLPL